MTWLSDFYNVSSRSNNWNPRCDYRNDGSRDHLVIEVPGASRGDLRVDVAGRYLTVEAKRDVGRGEQKWKCKWIVPDSVNVEAIEAKLESGILDISFPLTEPNKSRSIEIF